MRKKATTLKNVAGRRTIRFWRLLIADMWSTCGIVREIRRRDKGPTNFFEQTVQTLDGAFIIHYVLCDSGFYRIDFIEYLENKGYSYILAVPITAPIQQQIAKLSQWEPVDEGLEVGEFYFQHADAKWTKPRRYVVVRQHIETRPSASGKAGEQMSLFEEYETLSGYRYSVMISNDTQLSPLEIWRHYRPRANDENVLKDLKEGFGFGAFNLHSFWATEAVMVTTALVCYNLLRYLDSQLLNRNQARRRSKTIRSKWFILPGQLGNSGGSYRLRIAVRHRKIRAKIVRVLHDILRLPHRLDCDAVAPP